MSAPLLDVAIIMTYTCKRQAREDEGSGQESQKMKGDLGLSACFLRITLMSSSSTSYNSYVWIFYSPAATSPVINSKDKLGSGLGVFEQKTLSWGAHHNIRQSQTAQQHIII